MKKKLSIKLRITLWFSIFMMATAAISLAFLFSVGEMGAQRDSAQQLKSAVEKSFQEIEYEDGALEIDEDLDVYKDGVYISVYDDAGHFLYGRIPYEFPTDTDISSEEIIKVTNDAGTWYVFDHVQIYSDYGKVHVRGIASAASTQSAFSILHRLTAILLPVLVVISALGGYFLACRAFRPVKQITETAENISQSGDLALRIQLPPGKDEIHALANTFDGMFDRLQAAFEAEKQFTSDAAHELRTPTSVILSQCEYALENATTVEETKEALTAVQQQAEKMARLISQLLTLARADSGTQKLQMELVNLSELTEIVCQQQQEYAATKQITIATNIQPDILFRGDETMLMRLWMNLMENGIHYGKENGHLTVSLFKEENRIVGSVADDGIGIAPEHLDRIWQRFYQVDTVRDPNRDSTGLGLSMVKWIVQAHGGSIFVKSALDEGSTFTFAFPVGEKF